MDQVLKCLAATLLGNYSLSSAKALAGKIFSSPFQTHLGVLSFVRWVFYFSSGVWSGSALLSDEIRV